MAGVPGAGPGVGPGMAVHYEESTVRQLKEKVEALARAMQGSKERQESKKDRGLEMELLLDGYDARTQSYTEEPTLSKKQMLDHFEEARSKLEEVARQALSCTEIILSLSLSLSFARASARTLSISLARARSLSFCLFHFARSLARSLARSRARSLSLFLSLRFQAVVRVCRPAFWSSWVCSSSLPKIFVR
jgi:hypothetical protein